LCAAGAFCGKLINKGERTDATKWIEKNGHTLGERDPAASRRLVARRTRLRSRLALEDAAKVASTPRSRAQRAEVRLSDGGAYR